MKVFFAAVIVILITGGLVSAEEAFEYDAKGKRDPFVPLGAYVSDVYGVSGIGDIRLEGIVWDEAKGSIAIINGEIIKEGGEVGSLKVLKIEKDAVTFEIENEKVRVELIND